jgi:hypothetical protein
VVGYEICTVEAFMDDYVQHGKPQRHVCSHGDVEPFIRRRRQLSAAGVDNDQPAPSF